MEKIFTGLVKSPQTPGVHPNSGWFTKIAPSPKSHHQIKSFLLVYGAVKTTINDPGVVWVYGKGHWGVRFCVGGCVLRECVMGGGGGLRGTETASGHPGVSWKISPRIRWLSQSAVCSRMGQPEWWRRIGDSAYSIAVGGTWMPWGTPGEMGNLEHGY